MREETRDWIFLLGKSFLFIVGGILVLAGAVDLAVAGWNLRAATVLLVGLAMCLPPLGFAYRDAVREAKKGRI